MFRTVSLSFIRSFSLYTQQCICHTGLLTACEQDQDGTLFIRTHHDARSPERQIYYPFETAGRFSLFWVRSVQSTISQPIYLRYISILSSHLHLDLRSGLLLSDCPTKIIYATHLSTIQVTCPTYLIPLPFIILNVYGQGKGKGKCKVIPLQARCGPESG